jgi:hypothetical protein
MCRTAPRVAGLLPGVDYRGAGGYVVLPPSVHSPGERYQWSGSRGWKLDPLPPWLAQLVERHREVPVDCPEIPVAPGRATAYGRAALRRELDGLALAVGGTRNHELNRSVRPKSIVVGAARMASPGWAVQRPLGASSDQRNVGAASQDCLDST